MKDSGYPPVTNDRWAFMAILIAVSAAFAWILLPFLAAILWAVIAAILFTPIYTRLLGKMQRRPRSAALLTLLLIVALVIVPAAILSMALVVESPATPSRLHSAHLHSTQ